MTQKPRKNAGSTTSGAGPVADAPRTEGQRLLLAVPGSQAEIAATLDVAKSTVGFWRRGEKTPDASARVKMRDAYGIDPRAWDLVTSVSAPAGPTLSTSTPAPAPVSPTAPHEPKRKATLDEVRAQIDRLLKLQDDASQATIADRLKIIHELNGYYKTLAQLEEKQELFEDRAVREHPFYLRIKRAILVALKPHPEAMRGVCDALAEVEGS